MNKLIREHYPVDRLPEDLKAELGSTEYVRLVIEETERPSPTREELLALIETARLGTPATDNPVQRIRKLRDEWDA